MNKKQNQVVATAVGVAVASTAAAWFLAISPQRAHAADSKQAALVAVSETTVLTGQIADLTAKRDNLDKAIAEYRALESQFPADFEVSAWLRLIARTARENGVRIGEITPAPATLATPAAASGALATPPATTSTTGGTSSPATTSTTGGTTVASPIGVTLVNLTASGSMADLRRFAAALGHLDRPLLIENLGFSQASGEPSATISGRTFLLRPLPAPEIP